jgi:methyl-accepting chemotaxis protein
MTNQPDPTIGIQYELRQLATATTELAERINDLREAMTTGFTDLKQITQQQATTAQTQAESVTKLISLLERDRQ